MTGCKFILFAHINKDEFSIPVVHKRFLKIFNRELLVHSYPLGNWLFVSVQPSAFQLVSFLRRRFFFVLTLWFHIIMKRKNAVLKGAMLPSYIAHESLSTIMAA